MEALITMASVVLARDFRAERARTLATLGLDGMTASDLAAQQITYEGAKSARGGATWSLSE